MFKSLRVRKLTASALVFGTLVSIACLAQAQPVLVPGAAFVNADAAKQLAQKCQPDCLVLDREDWAKLQALIVEEIKARAKALANGSV